MESTLPWKEFGEQMELIIKDNNGELHRVCYDIECVNWYDHIKTSNVIEGIVNTLDRIEGNPVFLEESQEMVE